LRDQVSLLELTPRETLLADEFIGNINDDGYLACGVEDIVRAINEVVTKAAEEAGRDIDDLPLYTAEEGHKMLATIQSLDPPGVGAQDLRECLLLQLKEAGLEQSVPYRLVRDCFEELINHRWSEISKRFGISAAMYRRQLTKSPSSTRNRTAVRVTRRQLYHPRPDRRKNRRPVSRLSERR